MTKHWTLLLVLKDLGKKGVYYQHRSEARLPTVDYRKTHLEKGEMARNKDTDIPG